MATPKKSGSSKAGAKTTGKATQARGGIAQEVTPDADLAAVVGKADAKLKKVFCGKDSVSMFEMTKLVNQHVSKK